MSRLISVCEVQTEYITLGFFSIKGKNWIVMFDLCDYILIMVGKLLTKEKRKV